ncbi:MAG: hypothetical protein K2J80_08030 [Oscillospiraceae bacterium]|nr:hypothetical protein [Oscillospiraceae bacterium]
MKRYIDFFHIKTILIAAVIIFPIIFIITLLSGWSCEFGDYSPKITFDNAPENTAYVDILVKLPEGSEDYVDFAEWDHTPKKLVYLEVTEAVEDDAGRITERTLTESVYVELSITPDSEIAKLNSDGYVSLSVHYAGSRGISDSSLRLDESIRNEITAIKKRYGSFKAAYVDENGKVLGITKAARTRYNPKKPSSFSVNGDTLIFTKWGCSPLWYVLICVSGLGEPIAIIALMICIVLDKLQNKQLRNLGTHENKRG